MYINEEVKMMLGPLVSLDDVNQRLCYLMNTKRMYSISHLFLSTLSERLKSIYGSDNEHIFQSILYQIHLMIQTANKAINEFDLENHTHFENEIYHEFQTHDNLSEDTNILRMGFETAKHVGKKLLDEINKTMPGIENVPVDNADIEEYNFHFWVVNFLTKFSSADEIRRHYNHFREKPENTRATLHQTSINKIAEKISGVIQDPALTLTDKALNALLILEAIGGNEKSFSAFHRFCAAQRQKLENYRVFLTSPSRLKP